VLLKPTSVFHMLQVLDVAGKAGLRVFYALHRRYRAGDYETWKYIAPIQKAAWLRKTFEFGTWGGEIRREFEPQAGDIVAPRTLVFQWLRQHGEMQAALEVNIPNYATAIVTADEVVGAIPGS
jgi:ureidoacrylate peracid hydrolase